MNFRKMVLLALFVIISLISYLAFAQEDLDSLIWNILGSIWNTDNSFGFDSNTVITFSNQTSSSVGISFPVISKSGTKINKYNVFASTFSINNPNSMDNVDYNDSNAMKDENFTIDQSQLDAGTATVSLTSLNNNATYYVTVTPIDSTGIYWVSSAEKTVNIWNPSTSTTTTTDTTHSAWSANMALANVSHTNNGLITTITWTALDWADRIEFFYKNLSDWWTDMISLGKADMSDESFTFSLPSAGSYIIQLVPLNTDGSVAWTEFMYNLTVSTNANTTTVVNNTNPIPVTPPGWPAENVLFVVLLTAVWYVSYKKLYLKNS